MSGCNGICALNHYDVRPGKKVFYSGSAVSDFEGTEKNYVRKRTVRWFAGV
jgi:hypothetical protein